MELKALMLRDLGLMATVTAKRKIEMIIAMRAGLLLTKTCIR